MAPRKKATKPEDAQAEASEPMTPPEDAVQQEPEPKPESVTLTFKNNSQDGIYLRLHELDLEIKGCQTTKPVTVSASKAEELKKILAQFPAIQIKEGDA